MSYLHSAFAFALGCGVAHGAVVDLVWWNPRIGYTGENDPFVGQSTDDSLAMAGNLTASGFGRYGSLGTIGFSNVPTTFSEDHYIEFSLVPGAGQELKVHDLILQGTRNQGLPMLTDRIVLRTEADGFTSDIAAQVGPSNLQGSTGRPIMFDLEDLPAFDEEFTFRLYVWNTGGNFGIVGSVATLGHGLWFGDIDSNPVPTPSTVAMLGLAGLTVSRRRRR